MVAFRLLIVAAGIPLLFGAALAQAPDDKQRPPLRSSDESIVIEVLTTMLRDAHQRESLAMLRAIRAERLLAERSQPAVPAPQRPEGQK